MGNSKDHDLWILDSAGVISKTPVCVGRMVLMSNAALDEAVIYSYEDNPEATGKTLLTVASNNTVQANNAFTTSNNGDVFEVATSDGNNTNIDHWLILSRSDANNFVVVPDSLVNEANKTYDWAIHTGYQTASLKAANDTGPVETDFYGKWFPNFVLQSLSANAKLHVYIV